MSDKKVIGHSCSTVPVHSPWCALHSVQRYSHAFISLISQSHTEDITRSLSERQGVRCYCATDCASCCASKHICASAFLGRRWSVQLFSDKPLLSVLKIMFFDRHRETRVQFTEQPKGTVYLEKFQCYNEDFLYHAQHLMHDVRDCGRNQCYRALALPAGTIRTCLRSL